MKTSHPGRMAPNTALCYLFGSIAFLFRRSFGFVFSLLILMLGFIAFMGHIADLPTAYGWGKLTGMALPTSLGFIVYGIGSLFLALSLQKPNTDKFQKFLPAAVLMVGWIFCLMLWQSLVAEEHNKLYLQARNEASQIEKNINNKLATQMADFLRLKKRMEFKKLTQSEWLSDVGQFAEDINFYEGFAWWGPTEQSPAMVIKKTDAPKSIIVAKLHLCLEGSKSNLHNSPTSKASLFPLNLEDTCVVSHFSEGTLIGLINVPSLIKEAISQSAYQHHQIFLFDNEKRLSVFLTPDQTLSLEWRVIFPLSHISENLKLIVWPTELLLNKNKSVYPILFLISGFLFSVFLALSLYFWFATQKQARILQEEFRSKSLLELRFQAVTMLAKDAIIGVDPNGSVTLWNEEATRIFGYSAQEALGKLIHQLIIPERYIDKYVEEFNAFRKIASESPAGKIIQTKARNKSGMEFFIESSISTVILQKKTEFIAIIRDITERKKAEEIIRHQANYDALTDLPNRLLFSDRLKIAMDQTERTGFPTALLLIDLDNFKGVNDEYGHRNGDDLLKQTAERLLKCVRKTDTVARVGGDEFTIILTNIHNKIEINQIAEKILKQFSMPFIIAQEKKYFSTSIGVVIYPDNADSAEELIKKADFAMYEAKHAGKNRIHFYSE